MDRTVAVNTVSARFLWSCSVTYKTSKYADVFYKSLPVSGESGTLKSFRQNKSCKEKYMPKAEPLPGWKAMRVILNAPTKTLVFFALLINNANGTSREVTKNWRNSACGIEIKAGTEAHKQHHSVFHYVHKTNTFDQRALIEMVREGNLPENFWSVPIFRRPEKDRWEFVGSRSRKTSCLVFVLYPVHIEIDEQFIISQLVSVAIKKVLILMPMVLQ